MPALSSFYTFLSGAEENCTSNFLDTSDYVLSGNMLFINLSSNKWADVNTVFTTECALDVLDVRPFGNVDIIIDGSYQAYLSSGSVFYDTEIGTVSAIFWAGKTFPVFNIGVFYFGYSSNCVELEMYGKNIKSVELVGNTALTGIYVDPSCSLSATNYLYVDNNESLDLTSFENFLSFLATDTLESGGSIFIGVSSNATPSIATSIDTLTAAKSWVYL